VIYLKRGFTLKKIVVLVGLILNLFVQYGLWAATITAPNNQTAANINIPFGDTLDLPVTAGTDYFIQHAITGAGNNTIRITSGRRITVRLGGSIVVTDPSGTIFTTITGAGNWNGIRFQNNGQSQIHYGDLQRISGATQGMLFDNTTNGTAHEIKYTTIGSTTARPGTGIQIDTGSPAGTTMPILQFNNINATNFAVNVSDTNATPLTPPTLSHNYLFSNNNTHLRYFVPPGSPTTMYSELNYFGGGAPNVTLVGGAAVDSAPYLLSDPTTTNAGATTLLPFIINGGTSINGANVDLFSRGASSVSFYRLDTGDLTVAAGSTLRMGRNIASTSTGGVTFFAANNTLNLINNGTFNSTGTVTNPNTFSGPRGSIIGNAASTTTLAFTTVTSGNAIQLNGTAALNLNRVNINGNTTGLHLLGTGVPVITNTDIHTNTSNLRNDSATPLTINNVYWGSNPPSANLFSGTGIIDYEPWATTAYGLAAVPGTTSQAPATPNAFSPTDNAIIAGSVTQLQMTATDIGYYNNGTIGRMTFGIEIATDPNFSAPSIVERYNPLGAMTPFAGGNINPGSFDAGTYSNSVTATYTITSVLTPGTYYWRAAGYDPLGSMSYGNSGGSFTNPTATRNIFIIGAPSLSITLNAINVTKGQNPAINADAGDYIDYVITYANTGTQPANNAQVTNVLPSDTQFANNVIYNISSSTTVTVNVHSAVGGASVIGQDINAAAPAATNVAVGWNTTALGAAIVPNVLRIEFYFGTIPSGGSGTLTYRVRVK